MKRNAVNLVMLAAVSIFLFGCLSEANAQVSGQLTAEDMELYQKATEAAQEEMDLDEEELMEELKDLSPAERAERTREIREEMEEIKQRKLEEFREERRKGFFDDVDGDVAVYSKYHRGGQGVAALQDDGYVVEFCYAESGCEDRSDQEGQMVAGHGKGLLHASDPDKEVVGLKLRYKIHPESNGSGTAIVAEGRHDPDETLPADQFEIENQLMETEPYGAGESLSYELGRTDGQITADSDEESDDDSDEESDEESDE